MTLAERMAANLRAQRERRKMTQQQLAEKAGISRAYLARLETARQEPRLGVLDRLARALRVKAARLLE